MKKTVEQDASIAGSHEIDRAALSALPIKLGGTFIITTSEIPITTIALQLTGHH